MRLGLALKLGLSGTAFARISPRSSLDHTAKADSNLASRSISSDGAHFAQTSYDYIVVGGGTAGLAVAARLSESGLSTVGVLEAGGSAFGDPIVDIPGEYGADLGTKYDWNFTTAAGKDANAGVPSIPFHRGMVLGGTSVLNFLAWNRASMYEYDAWAKLGNPGWDWKSMYSYMKKAETFHPPSKTVASLFHINPSASDYGDNGAVQVSFTKYVSVLAQKWLSALESLGIPTNNRPSAGNNVGVTISPSDINPRNSTRSYAAPAYLFPHSSRRNLVVLTGTLVETINWSSKKSHGAVIASGVNYISGGKKYTVAAKREVIVSCGTVKTPQLLELSGIGGKKILDKAGVKVVVDLPSVGENVQEHGQALMTFARADRGVTLDTLRDNATFAQQQAALYANKSNNPVSILDEAPCGTAYVPLSMVVNSTTAKELVAMAAAHVHASKAPYKKTLEQQLVFLQDYPDRVSQMELIVVDQFAATTVAPMPDTTYVTLSASPQHLLSRGSVHINSSDASLPPIIDLNSFSVPYDVELAVAGLKFLRKIAAAKEYAGIFGPEVAPGPGVDLRSYTVGKGYGVEYHTVGSSSMLPRDQGGVVDSFLKVYGTSNVRVVDASIIPLHLSAHPSSSVYGIAEKAADIILSGR